jgi:preprotein translocase subunit SecE
MATNDENDERAREDSAPDEGPEPSSADESSEERSSVEDGQEEPSAAGDSDESVAATQLGNQRYILAAFFAGGMVMAYVLGRALHSLWAYASNKDFFALRLPSLAAIQDDTKLTYSMSLAGVVALVAVIRALQKPDVREWSDEVSAELTKVKWPTRKDVQNSTVVVLATSAIATSYLFLLDQLWSFVTNLIYGTGS